jgi:hypothetical protein
VNDGAAGQKIVLSAGTPMIAGAVVSCTVIDWLTVLLFPQ